MGRAGEGGRGARLGDGAHGGGGLLAGAVHPPRRLLDGPDAGRHVHRLGLVRHRLLDLRGRALRPLDAPREAF